MEKTSTNFNDKRFSFWTNEITISVVIDVAVYKHRRYLRNKVFFSFLNKWYYKLKTKKFKWNNIYSVFKIRYKVF